MSNFNNNLKIAMKNKKITRIELGKMIGMCPQQLSYYFSGKYEPNDKNKKRISQALGVPVDTMVHGEVPVEKPKISILYEYGGKALDVRPVHIRMKENLAYWIKFRNLDVPKLAEKTGMHIMTIYKYLEGNIGNPALRNIRSLADALGITVGQLLN